MSHFACYHNAFYLPFMSHLTLSAQSISRITLAANVIEKKKKKKSGDVVQRARKSGGVGGFPETGVKVNV